GEADLGGYPDVLEDVAVHEDALRILELEEVLDHPQDAGVGGIVVLPGQRLEEMIVPDLDVRGDEIGHGGAGAAEEDVLAGPFEVVVDELERPGAAPDADGLGVDESRVEVG